MRRPYLSIILPVFNEAQRVHNVERVYKFFSKENYSFEIIVVDDGSTDTTLLYLKQYRRKFPFSVISYSKNRGKGWAIKQGMLASRGEYCLFMDVDLSVPLQETQKFIYFASYADILIASRRIDASIIARHQHLIREALGRLFTWFSAFYLNMPISDFTCGFKLFSRAVVDTIFPLAITPRWGFDSEILYLAHKHRFSIKEVPVTWKHDPHTRVQFPRDIIISLYEVFMIRFVKRKN